MSALSHKQLCWGIGLVCGIWIIGCAMPSNTDPIPEPPVEVPVRFIPLNMIHTTNAQPGLTKVVSNPEEPYAKELEEFRKEVAGLGASNIFLVRGKDVREAIRATKATLAGSHSADTVVEFADESKDAPCWLVVHQGCGQVSPPWIVKSAEVRGNQIQLALSNSLRPFSINGGGSHSIWANVGELKHGIYTIELVEGDGTVRLQRRVAVGTYQSRPKNVIHTTIKQARQYPLNSLYSTNRQLEVRPVREKYEEPYGQDLIELYRRRSNMGASTIFLVSGNSIDEVVRSTASVLLGDRPVDYVISQDRGKTASQWWLTAYLGSTHSHPIQWQITSAQRHANTFQLLIEEPQNTEAFVTNDVHQYYAWVPLGSLEAGDYILELRNSRDHQVRFLRTITIMKNNGK